MVKTGAMRSSNRPRRRRLSRRELARRARLLDAFERSGLSGAAFARQQGLTYTTFCGWRQQRAQAKISPGFVQVELAGSPAAGGLVIELGGPVRLRIETASQSLSRQ